KNVPKVTWSITATDTGTVAGRHVIGKQLVGHVDNSRYPLLDDTIAPTLVVPAGKRSAVPVIMMFRGGSLAQALGRPPPPSAGRGGVTPPPSPPGRRAHRTDPPNRD